MHCHVRLIFDGRPASTPDQSSDLRLVQSQTQRHALDSPAVTATTQITVAWIKGNAGGAEVAMMELADDRLRATGVAIGSEPEPYRLDYELETAAGFVTSRLLVSSMASGWSRRLKLTRRPDGRWIADVRHTGEMALPDAGGDVGPLESAVDPDLGLSPLFNTLPLLRHRIHDGGTADDFLMAWISVPDLSVHASAQRYTHLETRGPDTRLVRFETIGEAERFEADLTVDRDGLVVDYPGIARRFGSARRPA
jgi:uncharacterized protein